MFEMNNENCMMMIQCNTKAKCETCDWNYYYHQKRLKKDKFEKDKKTGLWGYHQRVKD